MALACNSNLTPPLPMYSSLLHPMRWESTVVHMMVKRSPGRTTVPEVVVHLIKSCWLSTDPANGMQATCEEVQYTQMHAMIMARNTIRTDSS